LIEVKGMKAQGNQVTKLKVKEIVLEHPEGGDEPWPEDVKVEEPGSEDDNDEDSDNTMEWDMTDDDQPKLF